MLQGVAVVFIATVIRNFHLHSCYSQYVVYVEKITYCSMAIHEFVIDISYPVQAFIIDSTLVPQMDPSGTSQRCSMIYHSISLLIVVSADSIDCAVTVVIKVQFMGWQSLHGSYYEGSPLEACETEERTELLSYLRQWLLVLFSVTIANSPLLPHHQTIEHSADCYLHYSKIAISFFESNTTIEGWIAVGSVPSSHSATSFIGHLHLPLNNTHSHLCCLWSIAFFKETLIWKQPG